MSDNRELLRRVGDDIWRHMLNEHLSLWMVYGTDHLPDVSEAHAESEAGFAREILSRCQAIGNDGLSHEEILSLDILHRQAHGLIDDARFYWMAVPITPYSSPLGIIPRLLETHHFATGADLDHYLMLLAQYPALIHQVREKAAGQLQRGLVMPVAELDLLVPFHKSLIQPGATSGLNVDEARLQAFDPEKRAQFRKKVARIVDAEVNPALQRLVAYIEGPYRERAPQDVGLWQYPGGPEYYAYLVKAHTTLDVTPEHVHQIGLEQLEMLRERLDRQRSDVGFSGSLAQFREFLRTDARFFPKTPDEIGARLNGALDQMRSQLDRFFVRLAKAGVSAKRLPLELEGSQTFGYYGAATATDPEGHYFYNGSNLNQRTILTAEHLAYHEMLPGHHFQIMLQTETEELPQWRRWAFEGAYAEGWAEYAATLAREMGGYQDAYQWCGRTQSEFFLATRLVVDTGMGAMKWPRERALQTMREYMIESPMQLHTESLRYSTDMPGQALSYRMGYLKMMELRRKAEGVLGARFDLRRFNHTMVGSGSMPLPILEKHVDWFIAQEQCRP